MGFDLTSIEKAFLKSFQPAIDDALKSAINEIKHDIKEKVVNQTISDYYNDYDPSSYGRTENIKRAFRLKHKMIDKNTAAISLNWNWHWMYLYKSGENWIENDGPNRIVGLNNNQVERGWVFTNFMEGIHPIFEYDIKTKDVENRSVYGTPSWLRMRRYFHQFEGDYGQNILKKHLKKQCNKYFR